MKENTNAISGVLHHTKSKQNYDLRRYFPEPYFTDLIEQFWIVDWDLCNLATHTQQNLPDPNFHLIIEKEGVKVLGPVSKVYTYTMRGKGRIIGTKFNIGMIAPLLKNPPDYYIDKECTLTEVFSTGLDNELQALSFMHNDANIVDALHTFFRDYVMPVSRTQIQALEIYNLIKSDGTIFSVEQLSSKANLSKRSIQRLFGKYIGLSPKWLIRKYRLHHVLQVLENKEADIQDIVTLLDYTDQSHLIRDFKEIIGTTPGKYMK
ncbi:helix-turn-helix transcriptional regulator [Pseudoalteromonas luteoviolacea]|uniref:helix-turn-helix transcriptional regulator n=1 Tax=Pseudoalteromonas luteoviolacea TaxID=43657 RepID=UPI001B3948EF|nr:helix-turn-helix transcriptional regulator [Pseudoalteromonas luteoviolacea]MBQ4835147.1 helix-turn-helix transcriptional regulator [Pseudoalteromonas luteoviolacea]